MANPKTNGRMINKDISNSNRFASLSEKAAVLFLMLIPHYNSYGKMNGGAGFIKDEVCPKVPYLNYDNIPELLKEISDKTNVKLFQKDGRMWLHAINFLSQHQFPKIDITKLGKDLLPDFPDLVQTNSRLTPDLVQTESEVSRLLNININRNINLKEEKEKINKKEKEVQFFLSWNQFALKSNLISARELSDRRKQKASKRLSERPLVEWEEVFSLCARTPFLNGLSKDGWRASFDWITESYDNAVKILEGEYGQPLDEFCTSEVIEKLRKEGGSNGRNRYRESQQRTPTASGDITTKQDIYSGIGQKISTDE